MNNDFYYNDNKDNNVKYPSSQKNLLLIFIAIALIAIGYITMLSGIFDKVNGIETTTERRIVYVGEEETVLVKSKANGNFNPAVKFRSKSDNFTLSEDVQYGEEVETKITGSKPGEDTLIIEAGKDGKKEKETRVEVLVCEKPEITNTSDRVISLKENSSIQLVFNVAGECLKEYEIEIEDENIIELDDTYNLTAKKQGTTNLILKRNDDRINYIINVRPAIVAVKSVLVNTKSFNLAIGKTKKLSISVLPSDATNRKVTYASSDENIATVYSNGTVKGISVGTATITVTSVNDPSKKASVKVKVYKQEVKPPAPTINVTSIKFDKSSYKISYNETKKLTLGITPTDATNKSITCKSQNTTIVTVSYSGNTCTIKGIKSGTTTIEAYSVDGAIKATTKVTVDQILAKGIKLDKTTLYMFAGGKTGTLKATVSPDNVSNKNITWTSSNEKVAVVDKNGKVTAKENGSAKITATTSNGLTATATVKSYSKDSNYVNVYFLNTQNPNNGKVIVNNGESVIIKTIDNKYILLDAAYKSDVVANNIYNELKRLQKKDDVTIDYVILSHFHSDHYGNMLAVINNKDITLKNLIIKYEEKEMELHSAKKTLYKNLVSAAVKKGANIITSTNMTKKILKSKDFLGSKLGSKANLIYMDEGKKFKIGNYVELYLFNTDDVFKNVKNCKEQKEYIGFTPKESKSINYFKTDDNKYVYFDGSTYPNIEYKTTSKFLENNNKTGMNRYFYAYTDLDSPKTSPCQVNANSIALLIKIKTDANGNKYIYLPSDLQNIGFDIIPSDYNEYKGVYSGGSPLNYIYDNLKFSNGKFITVSKSNNKIPSETKVATAISKMLGKDKNNIIIYQRSHHGANDAPDAINILGINRKDIYAVANYTKNNTNSFQYTQSYYYSLSKVPAKNKLFSGNKKNGLECDVSYEGLAKCYGY